MSFRIFLTLWDFENSPNFSSAFLSTLRFLSLGVLSGRPTNAVPGLLRFLFLLSCTFWSIKCFRSSVLEFTLIVEYSQMFPLQGFFHNFTVNLENKLQSASSFWQFSDLLVNASLFFQETVWGYDNFLSWIWYFVTAFYNQTKFWQFLKILFKSDVASWACFWRSTYQSVDKRSKKPPRERERDDRKNRMQKRAKNVQNPRCWPAESRILRCRTKSFDESLKSLPVPGVVPSSRAGATTSQFLQLSSNSTQLPWFVCCLLY